MKVEPSDALIVVDVQNTFCPGGTLPVPEGDKVVAPINRVMPLFPGRVYASQDWHPEDHASFEKHGGIWPVHAVAGTEDAELHPDLDRSRITHVIRKAMLSDVDAYSAFDGTDLADRLKAQGVTRVFVTGLATDYCVKATALDARKAGLDAVLLTDAARPVDVNPGDGEKAIKEMQAAGVETATTGDLSGA